MRRPAADGKKVAVQTRADIASPASFAARLDNVAAAAGAETLDNTVARAHATGNFASALKRNLVDLKTCAAVLRGDAGFADAGGAESQRGIAMGFAH